MHGNAHGTAEDPSALDSRNFWDNIYEQIPTAEIGWDVQLALEAAGEFFGPLEGKTVLDLGCGNGAASLWFVQRGATVIAVDNSPTAIEKLRSFCAEHRIANLRPVCGDAMDLAAIGGADFIFGSMILHHLEPFPAVARALRQAAPRGFFFENSASSGLLLWCRRRLVGRFGIPKYGDHEEFPLQPSEIQELRRHFHVRQHIPYMLFCGLASLYLFHGKGSKFCDALDRLLYRTRLRPLSYRQYIYLEG